MFVRIRQKHVTWREIDGVVIALDLSSSTYFTTNRTGRVLWTAMVGGATIDELVSLLESSFGISRQRATDDVMAFVKLVGANNLLEPVQTTPH